MKVPARMIGVVANALADRYTHTNLNSLFLSCGYPDSEPEGNKVDKCTEWLRLGNKLLEEPLKNFGELIAEMMDEDSEQPQWLEPTKTNKNKANIMKALEVCNLSYLDGGYIVGAGSIEPTRALGEALRDLKVETLDIEYRRAYEAIEKDPPAAVTAACSLLESLCKLLLEREGIELPSKQVITSLWRETIKLLKLDPASQSDEDIKKILSALISISSGVGDLRTHEGSAHGRNFNSDSAKPKYQLQPRHARLAVHSSHTAALFLLETYKTNWQS